MPDGLSELEQRAWREVCGWLVPAGVMTVDNGMALLALVDALSALYQAREDGSPGQRSTARNDLLRACARFGLTPADRTNVGGASQAKDESKGRFFKHG